MSMRNPKAGDKDTKASPFVLSDAEVAKLESLESKEFTKRYVAAQKRQNKAGVLKSLKDNKRLKASAVSASLRTPAPGSMHNACIDMFEAHFAGEEISPELREAFEELKAAALTPNPFYQELKRRIRMHQGFTPEELTVATSYVIYRTMPTVPEIMSCMNVLGLAGNLEGAKKVLKNLSDEIAGKQDHVQLMHNSLRIFSDSLGFNALNQFTYPWSKLMLSHRHMLDEMWPGFRPTLQTLRSSDDLYELGMGQLIQAQGLDGELLGAEKGKVGIVPKLLADCWDKLKRITDLLPTSASDYDGIIHSRSTAEIGPRSDVISLVPATLRLALRESDSANESGILGIYGMLLDYYKDRFTLEEYQEVKKYVDAHIDHEEGVEDRHQADANKLALDIFKSFENQGFNSKQLAEALRSEAAVMRSRTKLAEDFTKAMLAVGKEQTGVKEILPHPAHVARITGKRAAAAGFGRAE